MEAAISNTNTALGRGRVIGLWTLRILLGIAFIMAGGSKLAGAPQMVAIYTKLGVGQWFRIVTGLLEVGGAVLLFVPRQTFYGAVLLAAVMIGALVAHLTILGGNPAPVIVLLALSGLTAWLIRSNARA